MGSATSFIAFNAFDLSNILPFIPFLRETLRGLTKGVTAFWGDRDLEGSGSSVPEVIKNLLSLRLNIL